MPKLRGCMGCRRTCKHPGKREKRGRPRTCRVVTAPGCRSVHAPDCPSGIASHPRPQVQSRARNPGAILRTAAGRRRDRAARRAGSGGATARPAAFPGRGPWEPTHAEEAPGTPEARTEEATRSEEAPDEEVARRDRREAPATRKPGDPRRGRRVVPSGISRARGASPRDQWDSPLWRADAAAGGPRGGAAPTARAVRPSLMFR